jgi:hypothetical protein
MRKLVSIFLLVMLFAIHLEAQNDSFEKYDMSKDKSLSKIEESANSILGASSERIITSSVIIGEVIILFTLLFYWKRTRNDSNSKKNEIYRKNIRAIRDERVKPNLISELSKKRKTLKKHKILNSLNGKSITNTAKKMSIAKGELFLAARITQLQKQNR